MLFGRFFLGIMGLGIALTPVSVFAAPDAFPAYLTTPTTSVMGATTVISAHFMTYQTHQIPAIKTRKVWLTAYSSDPHETDSTPFTTASGSHVRVGIVATNLYPFGTKIMIPSLFGDSIFVVEDRMHSRKKNNVDIWMPSKRAALRFGASYADIVVLESEDTLASAQN